MEAFQGTMVWGDGEVCVGFVSFCIDTVTSSLSLTVFPYDSVSLVNFFDNASKWSTGNVLSLLVFFSLRAGHRGSTNTISCTVFRGSRCCSNTPTMWPLEGPQSSTIVAPRGGFLLLFFFCSVDCFSSVFVDDDVCLSLDPLSFFKLCVISLIVCSTASTTGAAARIAECTSECSPIMARIHASETKQSPPTNQCAAADSQRAMTSIRASSFDMFLASAMTPKPYGPLQKQDGLISTPEENRAARRRARASEMPSSKLSL